MQERAYFQAYNPTALKFTLLSVIWERLCDHHSALLNGIFPAEQPMLFWAAQGGVSCVPSALSPCLSVLVEVLHGRARPSASAAGQNPSPVPKSKNSLTLGLLSSPHPQGGPW